MRRISLTIGLTAAGVLGSGPGPASPRIEAGPNILVTRDGDELI